MRQHLEALRPQRAVPNQAALDNQPIIAVRDWCRPVSTSPCRLGFFLCDGGEGSFPTFTMPLSRQIIICCLFISLAPSEIHMLDPTITCGLVLNERRPHFTSISEVKYPLVRYIAGNPSMVPSSFFHSLSWSAKADVRYVSCRCRSRWRFTVINQLVKLLESNQLEPEDITP
ncbi:unnamed protein product [Rhizophagus irregularis]|uniref:Uncharacterized protein n=1 Tax=Rhizophagus irregularis TaxID=588596 RepID=A0A916E5D1_9GLOM|nr:unnamed protein product [Rhizophagus irregularis]